MNNVIQTEGHARKKVYIGIDAHKETNSIALAFAGREKPEFYGKCSADLDRFLAALRKIQKQYDIGKEEVELCYEAGSTVAKVPVLSFNLFS